MNTTRQIVSLIALTAGLLTTSGCGSLFVCLSDPDHVRLYPGTRADAQVIAHPSEDSPLGKPGTGTQVFAYLDILPSAGFETVALPFELVPRRTNAPPGAALEPPPTTP